MTIHIRQPNDYSCLAASAAMAVGDNDCEDVFRYLGHDCSGHGGLKITDILPFLYSRQTLLGPMPNFVPPQQPEGSPTVEDEPETECIRLSSGVYSALKTWLSASSFTWNVDQMAEHLIYDFLKDYPVARQIMEGSFTGLNIGERGTRIHEAQQITIIAPITSEALISVVSGGEEFTHSIFWDGKKAFDPSIEEPHDDLGKYIVRAWYPLVRLPNWVNKQKQEPPHPLS